MVVQDTVVLASGAIDQRERRHRREHNQLRERVTALLNIVRRTHVVGTSHHMPALLPIYDFRPFDLLTLEVVHGHLRFELIVGPSRIWYKPAERTKLFQLKFRAVSDGLRCVVVPAGLFKRQPRLDNSLTIARTLGIGMTMSQRMRVELHLMETGHAELQECAELLGEHSDPFGAVLGLVASGHLELRDLNRPLRPQSELSLRVYE